MTTQTLTPSRDAADWSAIEPVFVELRDRKVPDRAALERWLLDRSAFDAACSETRANLYIAMTRRTDDADAAGAWTRYIEGVMPRLKQAGFALDRRLVGLADAHGLDKPRYAVLERDTRAEVALFREENVPVETRLARLDQEYDRICAAQTVRFRGKERTPAQMALFLEEQDRATRETAWRLVAERRLDDAAKIDAIFDEMVALRATLAANAGFPDYRDYAFKRKLRFDYGPAECEAFHDACQRVVVPLQRRHDEQRRGALRVDALRSWDLSVDVRGRAPLRPFDGADDLVSKCRRVFDRMGAGLGGLFAELGDGGCLDLESRKGKAPGGYQYVRDASRKPFIFMNAAGLHADVRTMLHEAGHAFHSQLCRDEPQVHYRHSPIEFAEVASMSMELLSMPFWDEFYPDEEDLHRAQREQLEGIVGVLPWIATIDAYQHWLYTNQGHTREQRTAQWRALVDRFGRAVSWEGLERHRDAMWRRQGHLFGSPFYYIEYGIAQLGALQLWLMAREQGLGGALAAYTRALSLGGSRPLPELFAAAGLEFDFSATVVERLMGAVEDELRRLPA